MRILVTAGNTLVPIDDVRCITNIFSGRTGALIALEAVRRGHDVALATSHPDSASAPADSARWRVFPYRTYEDLATLMEEELTRGGYAAVVHSAAVSDYLAAGVYAPTQGVAFDPDAGNFVGGPRALQPVGAGKIRSSHRELWIRMTPAPKLVDRIRKEWAFAGYLVKFKLEVGASDEQLLASAEAARAVSDADLVVANTLEAMRESAWLLDRRGGLDQVARADLAATVLDRIESASAEASAVQRFGGPDPRESPNLD